MTDSDNVLQMRMKEFLVQHPPFSMMKEENLQKVLTNSRIRYIDRGDVLFTQGEEPGEYFYIVRKGAVKLELSEGGNTILFDVCGEGDVFGIRPIIARLPYLTTGTAQEESIIYLMKGDDIRKVMKENSKVAYFLASSFAAGVQGQEMLETGDGPIFFSRDKIFREGQLTEVQTIQNTREPVVCFPDTPLEEAARIMTREGVSSIVVVNKEKHPLGIMTDSDLRKWVGSGRFDLNIPIHRVMQSPVVCLPEGTSYADAQVTMIQYDISQIVLTRDGTDETPILGVFSENALLAYQGNSPGMIIDQLKKTRRPTRLKEIRDQADVLLERYLHQDVSIRFISDIMTAIDDALYVRAIEIARENIRQETGQSPPVPFVWVAIGSHGRREQILRTDQDHALIFQPVARKDYPGIKQYFLDLADRVVEIMHLCGFESCPAEMMANNPKWCLSLDEWQGQFSRWISAPNNESILHANIFMDYRAVYGEVDFTRTLTTHIMKSVHENRIFLTFLAKYAVATPPPLSFFRNFILEKDGEHKDQFDIKQRGMLPLVDAARVLVLEQKVERMNNTLQRFDRLMETDRKNAELYADAREAYEILMKLRAQNGIKHRDSGRYILPVELNKTQRLLLRNSFKPIEEIQEVLNVRFQLKFF